MPSDLEWRHRYFCPIAIAPMDVPDHCQATHKSGDFALQIDACLIAEANFLIYSYNSVPDIRAVLIVPTWRILYDLSEGQNAML